MSIFITLEGGEGSGKSSQINRLAEQLSARGYDVLVTREPGGTPEGEKIRNLLVQRDGGNWTPCAETLLLFAARVMHINSVIKPALDRGCIVISDRFTDSTLAYQGYGHGYDLHAIAQVQAVSIGDFKPQLTFILDIDVREGLERSNRRLSGEEGDKSAEDRFERLDLVFHEKLRNGFLLIAAREPERCILVNAKQSIEQVASEIFAHTIKRLHA